MILDRLPIFRIPRFENHHYSLQTYLENIDDDTV